MWFRLRAGRAHTELVRAHAFDSQGGAIERIAPSGRGRSFLALGDSYTIGEGVAAADRWPMQVAAAVRDAKIDLADPSVLARTGWTTGDLLAAMDAAPLAKQYDLVTLMIGVNNQFQHRPIEEYRTQLQTLLDRAISLAGGKANRVIVLSIPDMGNRFRLMQLVDAWNNVPHAPGSRTVCGKGGNFAIIGPKWSGTLPPGLTELCADGPHNGWRPYLHGRQG